MTFSTFNNRVEWQTVYGPVPLSDADVEALLDLLEPIDGYPAAALYNGLYYCHRACGGFERMTSRRSAQSSEAQPLGAEGTDAAGEAHDDLKSPPSDPTTSLERNAP